MVIWPSIERGHGQIDTRMHGRAMQTNCVELLVYVRRNDVPNICRHDGRVMQGCLAVSHAVLQLGLLSWFVRLYLWAYGFYQNTSSVERCTTHFIIFQSIKRLKLILMILTVGTMSAQKSSGREFARFWNFLGLVRDVTADDREVVFTSGFRFPVSGRAQPKSLDM